VSGVPFKHSAFGVTSLPYLWTPYQCRHIKVDPNRSTDLLDESFRPVTPIKWISDMTGDFKADSFPISVSALFSLQPGKDQANKAASLDVTPIVSM